MAWASDGHLHPAGAAGLALPDRPGAGVRPAPARSTSSRPWPSSPSSGRITGFVASYPTAEFALVGYTLLILIWNTVAGLDAVPADAREAAMAMGYTADVRAAPGRPPARPPLHLRRPAHRRRHRDRAGHRHRADRAGRAGPADHLRLHHRLLHADHRGARPLGGPGRGVSTSRWSACNGWPSRGPGRPAGRGRSEVQVWDHFVHFLARVFHWFTTVANWTRVDRDPRAGLAPGRAVARRGGRGRSSSAAGSARPGAHRPRRAGGHERGQRRPGRPQPRPAHAVRHHPSISLQWGGFLAAFIALFVLAIPPILTNTYVGMREVDTEVRDAANAMGLTGGQVLGRVELPLASRS